MELTDDERHILDLLMEIASVPLPKETGADFSDGVDIATHLRAIQNIVLGRPTLRKLQFEGRMRAGQN